MGKYMIYILIMLMINDMHETTNCNTFFMENNMLYSYDIFDTLITRVTYKPNGINIKMQEDLLDHTCVLNYIKYNYSDIRTESEIKARNYNELLDIEEVTLDEIFACMNEYGDFNDIDSLKKMEIALENQFMLPITQRIDEVKKLLESGNYVILISDMYLGEDIVRNMLVSIDTIFRDIPIYVSCDYKKTKNVGSLYTYIHNKYNVEYRDWHHTGDNYHSDYLIPKTLGINCELLKEWSEYEWIKSLKRIMNINSLEMQIVLGTVKYISEENDSDLVKMGKSFAGIILEEYAEWIIDRAINDGIKELYFIARDGYVIKKVVDRIIQFNSIDIHTKYIYGSRKAWRVKGNKHDECMVRQYFKENVDFNNTIAFVDANGYGISIATVADVLGDLWSKTIPVYYFSFHRHIETNKCRFNNYCYNTSDIIELLCSATHGTTVGYCQNNGKIEPVIDESTVGNNIDGYIDGVLRYTEAVIEIKNKLKINMNFRKIVKNLLEISKYKMGMSLHELWNALNSQDVFNMDTFKNKYVINEVKKKDAKRVVIYGAGKIGKKIFDELNNSNDTFISAWTDIDFERYRNQGLPTISINEAMSRQYDYIIIAIRNSIAIKSAKCILKELGVDESKIRYIDL